MDQQVLTEVVSVLELANQNDSASQRSVRERMQVLVANVKDIALYFFSVFVSKERPDLTRQQAGFYLKQHFRQYFTQMLEASQQDNGEQLNAMRRQLEESILDPSQTIRETGQRVDILDPETGITTVF